MPIWWQCAHLVAVCPFDSSGCAHFGGLHFGGNVWTCIWTVCGQVCPFGGDVGTVHCPLCGRAIVSCVLCPLVTSWCGGVSLGCGTIRLWYAILHADVLTEGVWKAVAELQDPELKRLAAVLPDTVLRSCADSTSKKYINAFQRWRARAELHDEVTVYPVVEAPFALYLQHVGDSTRSQSAVEEAYNAINWVQKLSGTLPISESSFVRTVVDGLKRKLAKPKIKKEPVTSDMLTVMVNRLYPIDA